MVAGFSVELVCLTDCGLAIEIARLNSEKIETKLLPQCSVGSLLSFMRQMR
jgi:hypothetical protein